MTDSVTQFDRRQMVGLLLASSALAGCAAPGAIATGAALPAAPTPAPTLAPTPANAATAQARALYDRLFDQLLRVNPESATSLGLDTGDRAGLRGQLSSSSAARRFGFAANLDAARAEVAAFDANDLPPAEQTYFATLRWFTDQANVITRAAFGGFDGYPTPYPITQLTGSYQSVPDFLDSTHPLTNETDANFYLARLIAMGSNIFDEIERVRTDAARGVIPPDFIIAKTLEQTRNAVAQQLTLTGLSGTLARRATAAGLDGPFWKQQADENVAAYILPALQRQVALLEELAPRATHDAGISAKPDGAAYYAACLAFHTSTGLTPDEAHQRGLDEVASYQARLNPLLRGAGLTTGSVGARLTALGQRPDQLWPNTDEGRAAILAFANQRTEAIRPMMAQMYPDPPPSRLEIRRVPPAIEAGAPRGYAQSGSLDGSRPGAFYINLRDTRGWPRFSVPTLVYHEGLPGHIFQGAVLLAAGNTPYLHRTLNIAAYGEGWGLYAEQLADELGVYADEPLGRIGYLQAALYRACRVVVDTGMHARSWSRERAIAYMIDNAGLPQASAVSEIERYVVWPGQATSYKLGHSEIVSIRAMAQSRLGSRFDIRQFHKLLLDQGSQPLELLRRNVELDADRPII